MVEVEALMGKTEVYFPTGLGPIKLGWLEHATLFSDEYCLEVYFDRQRKVTKTAVYSVEPSHFRRLLEQLSW
jgi:hypothetical protein